ncbi:hypothetical protein PHLCEN_2v5789 [Hermanssonia centrifuga]|uniref:Uncharacterized protein n=1 Tax=Hermanssonia centrifuga TaxID=98765 RepID=A0A2R6P1C4_9APHY|nr:hypothetical protein PHLCEN_2v5789 [Hermanssonia centrifuga]
MALEFCDTRTDAEHRELEQKITENIAKWWWDLKKRSETPSPSFLWYKLLIPVICPSMFSGASESHIYEFFDTNREALTPLLNTAWETQRYKDICSLKFLNPPKTLYSELTSESARMTAWNTDMIESETAQQSWAEPFKGQSHILMVNSLNQMNRKRFDRGEVNPYSNYTAVVQSSGTGKTRTVHEAAKLIFTMHFNLRPDEDTGYPLADKALRNYLLKTAETEDILLRRYIGFFGALFDAASVVLGSMKNFESYQTLAAAWQGHMDKGDHRESLYAEAIRISEVKERSEIDIRASDKATDAAKRLLHMIVTKSGPTSTQHDICILLAYDESHDLAGLTIKGVAKKAAPTYFQILVSASNIFINLDIFSIHLSTNSNLALYSPGATNFWSADVPDLQTPIIELPFDVGDVTPLATENAHSMNEAKHSKPFSWWTRFKNGNNTARSHLISLAVEKLNGTRSSELTDNGRLSALKVRLLLDFEPRRQISVKKEMELVAGHMLINHCVPVHREYMWTSYPSEPILAEAAAQMMFRMDNIPTFLQKQMDLGLISKGDRGELVARLLLTLAHDRVRVSRRQFLHNTPIYYSHAIPLIDFLRALISASWIDRILDSFPTTITNSDPLSLPFREAFKDARVNFTHFVRAGDSSIITDEGAWLSFVRGMAIQCSSGQRMIDLFLPVLLRDEKIGRHVMSGVFIQIKNRRQAQRVHIDADRLNFFSPNKLDDVVSRPYVSIVMNLGTHQGFDNPTRPRAAKRCRLDESLLRQGPQSASKVVPSPPPVRSGRARRSPHPRYAFTITGCSSSVYSVVEVNEKPKYAFLLASRSLVNEYPYRDDPERFNMIMRMKPVWVEGSNSYGWAAADEIGAGPSYLLESQTEEMAEYDGVVVEEPEEEEEEDVFT